MKHSKSKGKKPAKESSDQLTDYDDPIKPDNQLNLSPDELDEQHGNVLYIKEPLIPQANVIYSNKKKTFVPKTEKPTFITLINLKSSLLYIESVEAQVQTNNELCRKHEVVEMKLNESMIEIMGEEDVDYENDALYNMAAEDVGEEFAFEEGEMIGEMSAIGEENTSLTIGSDMPSKEKESHVSKEESEHSIISLPVQPYCAVVKLKNKFSFFDRNTGTLDVDTIDKDTQTRTTKKYGARVFILAPTMYDAYCEDYAIQEAEKEKEMKRKMAAHIGKKKHGDGTKTYALEFNQVEYNSLKIAKTVEKIISFKETEAVAQDFRYYEDQSDQFRGKAEGTLMMMWSMVYDKEKTLIVTDISWSPDYFDMFGITLSLPLNTIKSQTENPDVGYVCLWSLKNWSYPDVINETHSGAICLSFNPSHGHIYVVGLRDGTLAVYNTSLMTKTPLYETDDSAKHSGCVRQVLWGEDLLPTRELNFFSVSNDGTVCQWILLQNEMIKIVKVVLTIDMHPELEVGGIKKTYNGIGTTIVFNPKDPEVFLVGSVEGYIFKCNTEWSSYVRRFRAHNMQINRIDYNKFDPNIYLTCSEGYTVKVWDDRSESNLLLINLGTSLSDVRWSPFSSTVFCVITDNCHAIFYDLEANTKKSVCDQLVQPPETHQLVRLAFDRRVPLIVIGSLKGTVTTFKLSPNLRAMMKSPKKGIQVPTETLEFEKLQTVLQTVRSDIH